MFGKLVYLYFEKKEIVTFDRNGIIANVYKSSQVIWTKLVRVKLKP